MKKSQLIESLKKILAFTPIFTFLSSILFFIVMHSYNIGFFNFFSISPYYFTLSTNLLEFLTKLSSFLIKTLFCLVLLYLFYSLVNYLYNKDKTKIISYILYYLPSFFILIFLYPSVSLPKILLIFSILMAIIVQLWIDMLTYHFILFKFDFFNKQVKFPSILHLYLIPKFKKSKLNKINYSLESSIKTPKQIFTFWVVFFLISLSMLAYTVGDYSAKHQKNFVIIDNKYAAIYINQNNGIIIPCILDSEKNTLEILVKEGYMWTLLNDKQQQYKKFDKVIVSSQ